MKIINNVLLKVHRSDIKDGVMNIPEGVVSINCKFHELEKLEHIIFPSTVIKIAALFSNCNALQELNIPCCVKRLYISATLCGNLKSMTLADSIVLLQGLFIILCANLEQITFSKSITSANNIYIDGCPKLEAMILPQSLQEIFNLVVTNCENIKKIHIDESCFITTYSHFRKKPNIKKLYEHPLITTVDYIVDKEKKGECISTKENSKGSCLIFIVNIEESRVIDVINTDIILLRGQIVYDVNDDCHSDVADINHNLKSKGYELGSDIDGRTIKDNYVEQALLMGVLMLYSDYCNYLTTEELAELLDGNIELYNELFPKRNDYITDNTYPSFFQIKSRSITKREFLDYGSGEFFLWSDYEA